ncbi:MAG: 5-formyltetrahydrofolate cyclo-ligase, partial [Janthinobacterium lividum]
RMRRERSAFVAEIGEKRREIAQKAMVDAIFARFSCRIVAGYFASGSEIDPSGYPGALAFPRVLPGGGVAFHACPRADLRPGFAGIPEPDASSPLVEPDVVLVPLVAVDRRGNRIGQGGGHYDRTLDRLRAHRPVVAIGVAWDIQLVDSVLTEPWDQPLDAIATPTQWLTLTDAVLAQARASSTMRG